MAGRRKIPFKVVRIDLNGGAAIPAGTQITADLRSLPDEAGGDPLYVKSIRFVGTQSLTNATGGNFNMFAQALRSIAELKLDVPGHSFLQNMDGERVAIDEMLMTGGSRLYTNAQVIANGVGAANYTVDFALHCGDPRNLDDKEREEDLIPVALLKARGSALSFAFRATMGVDAQVVSTAASLYLEFTLVSKPDLIEPAPWYIAVIDDTQLTAKLIAQGAYRYAFVNNRSLTTLAPMTHVTNVGDLSLSIDGESIYDAMPASRAVVFHEMIRNQLYADGLFTTAFVASTGAWSGIPLVLSPAGTRKTKLTRGDLSIKFAARPSAFDGRTSIFHRCTGVALLNVSKRWHEAMNLPADVVIQATTRDGGDGGGAAPMLPRILLSRNLPFAGPAARSAKKLAKMGA